MKFFTRCKVFKTILSVIDVILGIVLAFQIPEISDIIAHTDAGTNRSLILLLVGLVLFVIILIAVVFLNCVIKDAEEDLSAVMRLSEKTKDKE